MLNEGEKGFATLSEIQDSFGDAVHGRTSVIVLGSNCQSIVRTLALNLHLRSRFIR